MLCPVCKTTHLAMMDRQGVEVDYVPDCLGIWLDRGELDRLIARAEQDAPAAAATPAQVPPPPYGDPQRSDYGQRDGHGPHDRHKHHDSCRHGKKPNSLLGEQFDF